MGRRRRAAFEGQIALLRVLVGLEERNLDRLGSLEGALQTDHIDVVAQDLGEVFDLRKIVEVLEAELEEKLLGGAVEQGPADDFLAAQDLDEPAFQQRLDHAARLDPAQFDDLGQSGRLLVGDDGQGFEGLGREPGRRLGVEQFPHPFVVLGAGRDLVAARHLDELKAAIVRGIEFLEFQELGLDHRLVDALEHPQEFLHGHRFLGHEGQGFEDGEDFLGPGMEFLGNRLPVRNLSAVGWLDFVFGRFGHEGSCFLNSNQRVVVNWGASSAGPTGRNRRIDSKLARW